MTELTAWLYLDIFVKKNFKSTSIHHGSVGWKNRVNTIISDLRKLKIQSLVLQYAWYLVQFYSILYTVYIIVLTVYSIHDSNVYSIQYTWYLIQFGIQYSSEYSLVYTVYSVV